MNARRARSPVQSVIIWLLIVLVVTGGATATLVVARDRARSVRAQAEAEFRATAKDITAVVASALHRNADLMASVRTYITLNPRMTNAELRRWTELAGMDRYPGLFGFGFIQRVTPGELAAFASARQLDPVPSTSGPFAVVPAGTRPFYCLFRLAALGAAYTAINLPMGLDVCGFPGTSAPFERSRDTGEFTAYAPGRLASANAPTPGLDPNIARVTGQLIVGIAPVYAGDPRTVAERRAQLRGWVEEPFDAPSMLRSVLHSGRSISLQLVRHDGPSSLVVAATRKVGRGHSFAVVERFDADGLWTLHLAEPASGADATAAAQARWILAAGFGMTLLATLLLYVLLSARDRALRLIAVKTDELRRMAVIVESSDSAIVSTTPDLVVTSWNSGAERLFGRRSDDTIGVSFEDALAADGPGTFDVLREVGAGARVADYEATIRRRDGAVVVVSCVASPIMDSTGDVSGIAWIAHDITERRRLQTELRHAQKLESIGQLAAGIAHEINTPTQFVGDNLFFLQQSIEDLVQLVTRVDQETRRLAERDPDVATDLLQALSSTNVEWLGSESTAAVAQAREGVARVSTIVRAMKAFGHVSDEDKVAADLNEAIRNTLIVAANEIKHVADVETELGELPPLWCHIGDINQVLLNLIVNAVQAIAARDDGAKGTITVRTRLDGDDAVIEVADTGVGITPDIADRVFEPFFTTKEVGVGTGQGLALVYGLVRERHGGSITFTTEPNVGTTFTVRLPRSPESPRAPRMPRSGVPG